MHESKIVNNYWVSKYCEKQIKKYAEQFNSSVEY